MPCKPRSSANARARRGLSRYAQVRRPARLLGVAPTDLAAAPDSASQAFGAAPKYGRATPDKSRSWLIANSAVRPAVAPWPRRSRRPSKGLVTTTDWAGLG